MSQRKAKKESGPRAGSTKTPTSKSASAAKATSSLCGMSPRRALRQSQRKAGKRRRCRRRAVTICASPRRSAGCRDRRSCRRLCGRGSSRRKAFCRRNTGESSPASGKPHGGFPACAWKTVRADLDVLSQRILENDVPDKVVNKAFYVACRGRGVGRMGRLVPAVQAVFEELQRGLVDDVRRPAPLKHL